MSQASRIPQWTDRSFDGMLMWFSEMSARGLLFHPDNDPAEIVATRTGAPTFSAAEVAELRETISGMFEEQGGNVYEAGLPIFRAAIGQFDA